MKSYESNINNANRPTISDIELMYGIPIFENIFLNKKIAFGTLSALAKTWEIANKINVKAIPKKAGILKLFEFKSDPLFCFKYNIVASTLKNIPWRIPQTINVRLAPCQIPLTMNVIINDINIP